MKKQKDMKLTKAVYNVRTQILTMTIVAISKGIARAFEVIPHFQCEQMFKSTVEKMFDKKFQLLSVSRTSRLKEHGLQITLSTRWKRIEAKS